MTSLRPLRLTRVLVCVGGLMAAGFSLLAQQTTPPAGNSNNPFENIPQGTTPAPAPRTPTTPLPAPAPAPAPANPAVQAPQFETPPAATPANPETPGERLAPDVIEAIE